MTHTTEIEFLEDMQDAIDRIIEGPVSELDELLNMSNNHIVNIETRNAELLEALSLILWYAEGPKDYKKKLRPQYWVDESAIEQAKRAVRKAKGTDNAN